MVIFSTCYPAGGISDCDIANQMYSCTSFTVTVNYNDTELSSAVYSVQLIGPLANDMLQLWLMQKENDKKEIKLGVATFTLCNQTCTAVTETMSENSKGAVPTEVFIVAAIMYLIITNYFDDLDSLDTLFLLQVSTTNEF